MCLNAYGGFKKMTKFCKTRVPPALEQGMEAIKDDEVAIKAYGMTYGAQMCKDLMESGVEVLHFYTLNLEKVVYGILDQTGFKENASASANEADAATMAAVGSAWARVGDRVKCSSGEGEVTEMLPSGAAKIRLDSSQEVTEVEKGQYEKIF